MAIKSGQVVHAGNGVTVIDRIQSAGPGQLNIPTEKIYEVGNYKSVATIRDTPDLSFSMESYDVSTEVEAMLTRAASSRVLGKLDWDDTASSLTGPAGTFKPADAGRDIELVLPSGTVVVAEILTVTDDEEVKLTTALTGGADISGIGARIIGNGIELNRSMPLDIGSQFKAGEKASDPFSVVKGIGLPFLVLEQMSYRFGLRDNATQSATLRGDSIFYCPAGVRVEEVAGTGTAGQTIVTSERAYQVGDGDKRYVLSVTVGETRLTAGADYTESIGTITGGAAISTITLVAPVPVTSYVRIMYSSPTAMSYPQSVHETTIIKPAAVRGRDIEVYLGGYDPDDRASSAGNKVTMVQSANVDWRVTLEKDEEFGNYYAVAQDADVPTVNGQIDVKPRDPEDMYRVLRKITGFTDATKIMSTTSAIPLELDIVIKNPDTGLPIKRLHIPDARFTAPGYDARVQQKTSLSLSFESDEGSLVLYDR